MKSIMLLIVLIFVTACGKGAGGGGGSQNTTTEPLRINCSSKIEKENLTDYAVSSYRARSECNLTEDEATQYVNQR